MLGLHTLWMFFGEFYFVFGILMIFAGLWLMIFGGKMYKVTMFMAGQLAITILLPVILFAAVFPNYSPSWLVWINLMVAFGVGTGLGYAA